MMDNFSKWLAGQEAQAAEGITDSGQVAHFARMTIPSFFSRMFPPPMVMLSVSSMEDSEPEHKAKKKKKKKKKDDD